MLAHFLSARLDLDLRLLETNYKITVLRAIVSDIFASCFLTIYKIM